MPRQAVLWIAEGVFLRDDYCLEGITPPPILSLDARSRPPRPEHVHRLNFRLERYVKGGERVHYFLENRPPRGYRWLVVGKDVRVERVSEREVSERAAREAARALAEAVYGAQEEKQRQIAQMVADALFFGSAGLTIMPKYIHLPSLEDL
jgi:hypothetical protein